MNDAKNYNRGFMSISGILDNFYLNPNFYDLKICDKEFGRPELELSADAEFEKPSIENITKMMQIAFDHLRNQSDNKFYRACATTLLSRLGPIRSDTALALQSLIEIKDGKMTSGHVQDNKQNNRNHVQPGNEEMIPVKKEMIPAKPDHLEAWERENYELDPESKLLELALISPHRIVRNIRRFNIKDQKVLYEVAKAIAGIKVEFGRRSPNQDINLVEFIDDFNLDKEQLFSVAKIYALRQPSSFMIYFKIKDRIKDLKAR